MIATEDRYRPDELVTAERRKLMDWFLCHKVPTRHLRMALGRTYDIEDVIQLTCIYLIRWPGNRKYAIPTIVCAATRRTVFWLAQRHFNRREHEPVMQLMSDVHGAFEERRVIDSPEYLDQAELLPSDLKFLSDRQLFAIRNRFDFEGDRLTYDRIAGMFGVCKMRVKQIEQAGIARLKRRIERRMMERQERQLSKGSA